MKSFIRCIAMVGVLGVAQAVAATFTVTTTNDAGAGSLREAINNANTNSNADTIVFDIGSAGKTITPASALPDLTETVTIDGATQPGYSTSPIVELNGQSAGSGADGLRLLANNCVIRGLVINRFNSDGIEINGGVSNLVEGCYIGLDPGGTIDRGNNRAGILITNSASHNVTGGTAASAGNVISGNAFNGVWISGSGSMSNLVLGNIIGLRPDGLSSGFSSGQNGIFLDNAPGNVIGGGSAAARNIISFISGEGVEVSGVSASGNVIQGNYIGTDPAGAIDQGNSGDGIFVNSAPNTQIGGSAAGQGNLISGNSSEGITVSGTTATNNIIQGNWIGTDATSLSPLENGSYGIQFTSNPTNNLVGGTGAGEGNVIAFNGNDGVYVNNGSRNAIRANSIYANGNAANEIGIDLGTVNGVTSNDNGDPDTGANLQQNYPLLTAATNHGSNVTITGSLNSTPSTQFALDFFANTLFDPSGNGQGEIYLGSTNVTTGADSNVNFTVTLPVGLTGRYVAATATDPNGNTSEFGPVVTARSTVATSTFTVINTSDSGPGSLRQAILDANVSITDGSDLINFAITNPGPHTISPVSALPLLVDQVIIDGYTQAGASPNTLAVGDDAVLQIQLDGNSAPNNVPGLVLWGGSSVVRGLGITRFKSGSGYGIEVSSSDNVIEGNFIGVGLDGSTDLGNATDGVHITAGNNNLIGGVTPAARNLIGGNSGDGIEINSVAARDNVIQGNYIGTDRNGGRGAVDLGNNADGVFLSSAPGTMIGGNTAGAGNLIADNGSEGVSISGSTATNNLIQGNLIGVDVNGAALGNNAHGILVASSFNVIGGVGNNEANTIANSNGDGVSVSSGTGNSIRGNSIFENGGTSTLNLGIDLGGNGVLPNEAGDGDGGANLQQNYPILTNTVANATDTQIQGTLSSQASTTYELDFYSSLAGDPSANGEGQKWLGATSVNTDGSGDAAINVTVSSVAFGRFITATATDPNGNTSEFSPWIRASSTVAPMTFSVTNTDDTGPGSLRQAIADANVFVSSGNDIIAFAISGAGPHQIAPTSALPSLTDPATIDGYTQSGAQTNNLADGDNAVIQIQLSGVNAPNNTDGLRLEADGCIVRGLAIIGFKGSSGDGIEVASANNTIEGNFIGLQTDGTSVAGNAGNGVLINGVAGNKIGGTTTGARNVISGNSGDGIEFSGVGASSNIVAGNFIGTDTSGTLDKGNNADGVFLNGAPGNLIGGATAASRNVISGNTSEGITIQSTSATNNQVLNNYIGTDVTGALAVGNNSHGVQFTSGLPSGNQIGSPNPGGNLIAFNGQDGVFVSVGTNNAIRANSIHNNGGVQANNLGIDLGSSGVLANDFPDVATGANLQQNHPELTSATANPVSTTVQGTLRSRANTTYQLDFFSSLAGDPSGNGEGQKWLGATNVTTDANASNVFNVTVSGVVLGRFITATATDPAGNTSEFSPWIRAGSTIPSQVFTVVNTNDSGPGSLREAILLNNLEARATNNLIEFDITTAEPHVISPLSALPVPMEPVTIDGYSQTGASENTLSNGNNAMLKIRLDGTSAGSLTDGLSLTGVGGNIVRGLSITRFRDGIELGTNGNNHIEGNFIGLDVDGVTPSPNSSDGVLVNNSPANTIGGTTPGARNVISGNSGDGIELSGVGASNNIVAGNFIGTDAGGSQDRGNNADGVLVNAAPGNVIGGDTTAARNVISGNNSEGITIQSTSATNNQVLNNYIGTDVTGTLALGNNSHGVQLVSGLPSGNMIGSPNPGAGNLIAFNSRGVLVQVGTNNSIRANSIFANNSLGIDLAFDSNVTANDPGDPDTGANNLQNFPILSGATITPANTTVQGSLNSRPNTAYDIEFFASVFADASGSGEGQQYLGRTNITTGADSNANFSVALPVAAIGRQLTATATDPFGNTSEFSPAFAAASTLAPISFVVTNVNDSGPGSLRQAILDNNATPSSTNNTISFDIAGPGPHAIAPTTSLPAITESATIDGFTQPGSMTNSLAEGNNTVWQIMLLGTNTGFSSVVGLTCASPHNVIRGLVINQFRSRGIDVPTDGNRIEGNLIGLGLDSTDLGNLSYGVYVTGSGNLVGGATPPARNVISGNNNDGVYIGNSAANNRVEGNFIGTDLSGTLDRGNSFSGVTINIAGDNVVGGAAAGAGNLISGNNNSGVNLSGPTGSNVIQGNRIGTDVTGTAVVGNSQYGVSIGFVTNALVGGTSPAARNVISGNGQGGVSITTIATGVRVLGNYIGTDVSGTMAISSSANGVYISNANTNQVGGIGAGEGNLIAFHTTGVRVEFGIGNTVRGNSIFLNNFLGIKLGFGLGVTANDVGDADAGANNLQNFPVLTNAVANVGNTVLQGALNSRPNTTYQLDFFANDAGDSSGNGEGQRYLGSTNVTTDGAGDANFSFPGAALVSGRFVTATATDPNGNTSEFSAWLKASATLPAGTFTVVNVNDSGAGSLRQALLDVDLLPNVDNDLIQFAIPGAGVHTIAPLTQLPTPQDPVTIDGFTQTNASPNSLVEGNNAVLFIRLDGTNLPIGFGFSGLDLTNGNNVINGLEIFRFPGYGLDLNFANSNLVTGNLIWSNSFGGVRLDGSGNRIGGTMPAARNVISANDSFGVEINGSSASNNVVQGNFLGTDFNGASALGNRLYGVYVNGASFNLIGNGSAGGPVGISPASFTAAMRNVISGNGSYGVRLQGFGSSAPTGNRILGNFIGPDVTGTFGVANQSGGISMAGANRTDIGGTNESDANLIAYNIGDGVRVSSGTNNTVVGNSMHSNGNLGIDIGFSGVTANDPGDMDTGANHLQNFPVLTNAALSTTNLTVEGTLNSTPNTTYRLDFYSNIECDPSGNGEGLNWLGSVDVMTGADSNVVFAVALPSFLQGQFVSATATDPDGNTSEFSVCHSVVSTIPPVTFTVINRNNSGPGSLRQAILDNNAIFASGNNMIEFNIPGAGVQSVALLSQLPSITATVTIDGYTQPGASGNNATNGTNNAVVLIRLDGTDAGTNNVDGLHFNSSSNFVKGLCIVNFSDDGIEFSGGTGNVVDGCLIGIDVLPPAMGPISVAGGSGGSPNIGDCGITFVKSGFGQVNACFVGNIHEHAIDTTGFNANNIHVNNTVVGLTPAGGIAPVWGTGMHVTDGFGNSFNNGVLCYIEGDGATVSPGNVDFGFNPYCFGNILGKPLNRVGYMPGPFGFLNTPTIGNPTVNQVTTIPVSHQGIPFSAIDITFYVSSPGTDTFYRGETFELGITVQGVGGSSHWIDPVPLGSEIIAFQTPTLYSPTTTSEGSSPATVISAAGQPQADLKVNKTGEEEDLPFIGRVASYRITVTNCGPAAATNICVNDDLGIGAFFGTIGNSNSVISITQGETFFTATGLKWTVGDLASGESATIELVAQIVLGSFGNVTNSAKIFQAGNTIHDPDTSNNTDKVVTGPEPLPESDLKISKTDLMDPVTVGSNVTYTITVSNCGPSSATSVQVIDSLPSGASFTSIETTKGTTFGSGPTSGVDIPVLTNSEVVVITIQAVATAGGTLTNIASVSSSSVSDPDLGNNTAMETTTIIDVPPTARPRLEISFENGFVVLRWIGNFPLLTAPSLTGLWSDVPGATSPHQVNPLLGKEAYYGLGPPP